MIRRHRILLIVGITSLVFALLPWLGFGGYAFFVPGTGVELPRLDVLSEEWIPLARQLYSVMELPLYLLGEIPPLDDLVFFQGEGRVTVRPFMVFVFWLLVGSASIWIAIRPRILPHIYGHLINRCTRAGSNLTAAPLGNVHESDQSDLRPIG